MDEAARLDPPGRAGQAAWVRADRRRASTPPLPWMGENMAQRGSFDRLCQRAGPFRKRPRLVNKVRKVRTPEREKIHLQRTLQRRAGKSSPARGAPVSRDGLGLCSGYVPQLRYKQIGRDLANWGVARLYRHSATGCLEPLPLVGRGLGWGCRPQAGARLRRAPLIRPCRPPSPTRGEGYRALRPLRQRAGSLNVDTA
jgi:hypothetical protein